MMDRQTDEEAIQGAISAMLRDMWTCLPARVVSVGGSGSIVTAQPIPADYLDGEIVPLPQIQDVPVLWPRAGTASITLPLAAGDFVLLLVSSRSIARFRDDGSEGDPQSVRTHDLSDAMALPMGLWPDATAATAASSHVVIGTPSGGGIRLGGTVGTSPVVLDGDSVDMTVGGASGWSAWMAAVNAGILAAGGGVVPPPVIDPEVSSSATVVEAK